MENAVLTQEYNITNNQNIRNIISRNNPTTDSTQPNPIIETLSAEGAESFVDYIEWLGLDKDPNLVVLSSIYHYYYDAEEMNNVKTVINLKELNHTKDIKNFLHLIFRIIPPKSNFIGCFVDNEDTDVYELRQKVSPYQKKKIMDAVENGIMSRVPFLNRLYSIMDSRTNKYMSRSNVTMLMQDHGFKIINMIGINGLTYFCAQSLRTSGN